MRSPRDESRDHHCRWSMAAVSGFPVASMSFRLDACQPGRTSVTLQTSNRDDVASDAVRTPSCSRAAHTLPVTGLTAPNLHVRIHPKYAVGARDVPVRHALIGAANAPVIIVQGGISADCCVASGESDAKGGWWAMQIGAGRAIDLTRWRVLSINWLTGAEIGAPAVSSEDQCDALAAVLDILRIERVHAFVGASYGAMVGLAFAGRHAERLGRLVAISGTHRPHPLATAQRAIQRGILRLGIDTGSEHAALSLARQLGMTTYRGSAEFAHRFNGDVEFRDGRFRAPVEDWLEHAGGRFAERFNARRYLSLSESIDLHRINPGEVRVPTTLIGCSSDRLVPLADLFELQSSLGAAAQLEVIESDKGHDAFLTEHAKLTPLLRSALDAPVAGARR